MSALCRTNPFSIKALQWINLPIVEIGGGDGEWLAALTEAGVSIKSFDIRAPESGCSGVMRGDHHTAAAAADSTSAMLAVWPPDGNIIRDWIAAYEWNAVIVCACLLRIGLNYSLAGYTRLATIGLEPGPKGGSEMVIWLRNDTDADTDAGRANIRDLILG